MSEMPDAAAWQQLGEMLRRCRIGMDRRYAGRGGLITFTEERRINYRVAWDIENARRTNFTRATRREIEIAYGLPVRAIDDFLTTARAEADLGGLSPGERALAARMQAENRSEDGEPVLTDAELRAFTAYTIRQARARARPARNGERQRAAG